MMFFIKVCYSLTVVTLTFHALLSPLADPDSAQVSVKVLLSQLNPFFSSYPYFWAGSAEKFNYHLYTDDS